MRSRAVLSVSLSVGCVVVGFLVAWMANANHGKARELDRMQRRWEEQRAQHARLGARIDAHVPGVLDGPVDEHDLFAWPSAVTWSTGRRAGMKL